MKLTRKTIEQNSVQPELPSAEALQPQLRSHQGGRATWCARGIARWEWQTAPGVYSSDLDTQRVRTLGDHLELAEEAEVGTGWPPARRA